MQCKGLSLLHSPWALMPHVPLVARGHPAGHQDSHFPLCRAPVQQGSLQPVQMCAVIPPQVQDSTLWPC